MDVRCPGNTATTFTLEVTVEENVETMLHPGIVKGAVQGNNWFFLPKEATERNRTKDSSGCPTPIVQFTALREGSLFIEDPNITDRIPNRVVGSSVISAAVRGVDRLEFNTSSAGIRLALNKTLVRHYDLPGPCACCGIHFYFCVATADNSALSSCLLITLHLIDSHLESPCSLKDIVNLERAAARSTRNLPISPVWGQCLASAQGFLLMAS